ncbi:hypothetical protein SOASR015_20560 [Pectobacterium carotovorum subsp. carotovorum]|nr:hypothetical protein SOASR015_20560 [Pectobacterium carotovorum subsp. carotovorum]GLX55886.1 hypothetical protein Pcaca02_11950 [Pectobacterium carotovorum subsp. carotovorum]
MLALFGTIVLALGMGLGRFLYTPMLPVILEEGSFAFGQLSYIASATYAGYLFGSLFFSFNRRASTSQPLFLLFIAAAATGVLLLAMALSTHTTLVMIIRFIAGIASAAMMIFGSLTILHHTKHPRVIASLYAGVGAGIVLWAANRWGTLPCLTANLLIQGSCVLLTLFSHSPVALIFSCLGFGATFMGTTSLVMPLAKRLRVPHCINLLGLVTLTYGIGQILGPQLTSALTNTNAVAPAILCSAAALFIAAGLCFPYRRPLP